MVRSLNEDEAEILIEERLRERGWSVADFDVTRKRWREHLDGGEADRVFLQDGRVIAILEAKKPSKGLWAALDQPRRRFYEFVPYHYGPFAKELYADLEKLQEHGLVNIDNGDVDKTKITLAAPAKARGLTDQLPEELWEDSQTIIDGYGGRKHNEPLDRVYDKFPAYAKKASKKASPGRTKK